MTALSLYATATTSDVGSFSHSQTGANVLDPATIDAIGDKVADWQLANLDDLSYIRKRICATRTRIAVAGNTARCMVGLMNWADLPGNEQYDRALREISEGNPVAAGPALVPR